MFFKRILSALLVVILCMSIPIAVAENPRPIDTVPYDELPENTKAYIRRVEELTGAPVSIVAVGPERSQTIVRKEF